MSLSSNTEHLEKGRHGEAIVAQWLEQHGFTILAMNYRQRYGEIDLIARKYELVTFVEVKYRTSTHLAADIVPYSKQRKIIKTAKMYAALHHIVDSILRFDVAIVQGASVQYIPNAFTDMSEF